MPNQTGPKTPEGKQASSQNRRRHGLSTPNIIVHPADQPAFDEIEAELRNEIQPDGPLEIHAFHRLITAAWQLEQCRKHEGHLARQEPNDQNKANLEKLHRYYLRWEGSYNSAFRQLRLLQTDRGLKCVSDNNWPEFFAPLADVPKIERFAKRFASKPDRSPERQRRVADAPAKPVDPILSALCETKHPQVGRNSPCPCGSGQKYKRCCGVNAPPTLNKAA